MLYNDMLWKQLRTAVVQSVSEILIEIYTFSFKKIDLKMSFGKSRPFCLGLNMLNKVRVKIREQISIGYA